MTFADDLHDLQARTLVYDLDSELPFPTYFHKYNFHFHKYNFHFHKYNVSEKHQ